MTDGVTDDVTDAMAYDALDDLLRRARPASGDVAPDVERELARMVAAAPEAALAHRSPMSSAGESGPTTSCVAPEPEPLAAFAGIAEVVRRDVSTACFDVTAWSAHCSHPTPT